MYVTRTGCNAAGLSGCDCGGKCGGCGLGNYRQLAPLSTDHVHSTQNLFVGMGLFDSMDFTQWGVGEWAVVVLGVYVIGSILGDAGRGKQRVRKAIRKRSYSAKRRRKLQEELSSL
jgi:hypothetical protein